MHAYTCLYAQRLEFVHIPSVSSGESMEYIIYDAGLNHSVLQIKKFNVSRSIVILRAINAT